jgi:subtilisin family serine protease
VEQVPQVATRGFRRVGGLNMSSVTVDNKDDKTDADIAIVDSGVQPDQPDLRVAGGVDCADNTGNWGDVNGHGTMVAGIVAAKDNKFGIVGVAAGARIWSVRVLDSNLNGEDSALLCGLDWITANSKTINVANLSLEAPGSDDGNCGMTNHDPVHYAICQSVDKGVVYVAAAGNDATNVKNVVPAAYSEVIATSGIADSDGAPGGHGAPDPCMGLPDDTFAPFSNFGARIDIAAPSVCISSLYTGSNVATDSGTSFASPFVAGAAAVYEASKAGSKDLKNVTGADRSRAVRRFLLAHREAGPITGAPAQDNEGVLNVAGF